jgi:hypothetical protein
MTAKLTKNPASFTAWSIERNKERRHRRLGSGEDEEEEGCGQEPARLVTRWRASRRWQRLQTFRLRSWNRTASCRVPKAKRTELV